MSCLAHIGGDTVIHRLDPRVRVVTAIVFAFLAATAPDASSALAVAVPALVLVAMARIPPGVVARRLLPLNLFMLLLMVMLPFTAPGRVLFQWGRLTFTVEGLHRALVVALKGNAVLLYMLALLGTLEVTTLGHALYHLRLPAKLVHLLLFTARYIEVLHHKEYDRLVRAMRARNFSPRFNTHTYRCLGYLMGMLLVRSFDRSERILKAMKCRGFHGEFHVLDRFFAGARDAVFAALLLAAGGLLAWMRWWV